MAEDDIAEAYIEFAKRSILPCWVIKDFEMV